MAFGGFDRVSSTETVRAFAGDSTITNLPIFFEPLLLRGALLADLVVLLRFPFLLTLLRDLAGAAFLRVGFAVTAGLGRFSCAEVAPMRNKFVPQTEHVPRVPGVPVLV
jgi:hypothetical protein